MDINYDIMTSILSTLLGAFMGKQSLANVFNFFQRRKLKKTTNILETHSMFDKFDTDFKTEFILPDLKESYFYIQTGIETNEKSIQKYIEFKNKLGGKYTWADIKKVNEHLDLQSEEIKINLNKLQRTYSSVAFTSFPLILLTGFAHFYLHPVELQSIIENFMAMLTYLFLPAICGYLFVSSANSIFIAKHMEKRLKNL
jgi:hypothetical protein